MQYVRLVSGDYKNFKLIPADSDIYDHIKDPDKPHYVSIFRYNQEQYEHWKQKHSVAGITDVVTSKLYFDLDNKENLEQARLDTVELMHRLMSKGINPNNVELAFTGSKGFSVEVKINKNLTQAEFKNITSSIASGIESFDTVVNDPNRITRISGTKHDKSGLYKLPISLDQLTSLSSAEIKEMAANFDNVKKASETFQYNTVELPEALYELGKKQTELKNIEVIPHDLDLRLKPKWMSDAKYALQEGYFEGGERNSAFMILAATYKSQGFPIEICYRMLKGVAEIQAARNNQEEYSKDELWNNVSKVVYSPTWNGGNYSYAKTELLQVVTKRLGLKPPTEGTNVFIPLDELSSNFHKFATEIDKNTIKLGIEEIDKEVKVTTSMLVNLLAAPSAGKTSISLNVLNNASKNNVNSIFFSLDMGSPLVYQRLIQKHTGMNNKKIFELYKESKPEELDKIKRLIYDEYNNVNFCFKSGITPEDIDVAIQEHQEKSGQKVRLIVVDYLECISTKFSDPTASTGYAAQMLKDIANKHELTCLLLVQPQKHAGDPSSELLSMRNIKGSGQIEQAASVIFTMWRPGFGPKNIQEDRYLSMAVVKNRMGQLGKYDFSWDGLRGSIGSLDEFQREELAELVQRRLMEKAKQQEGL